MHLKDIASHIFEDEAPAPHAQVDAPAHIKIDDHHLLHYQEHER